MVTAQMNELQLPSLFHRLLGDAFERLPVGIRSVHSGAASAWFSGRCAIVRGQGWLARLAAALAGMPAAADAVPVRIQIAADPGGETWNRYFGERLLRSRMRAHRGLLVERLGLLTIGFRLEATALQIRWLPQAGKVLGIPLPASFFKGVVASESMRDDRYQFDVRAALPVVGLVIHYRGWLDSRG